MQARNSDGPWRSTLRAACASSLLTVTAYVAMGLAGCQAQTGNSGQIPIPAVTAAISFCNDGAENCEPATAFSVAGLRDLVITVAFQNVPPGNHVQQLEILLPGGAPYRVTQGGFLIPTGGAGNFSLTRNLPVVGTPVSLRRMTGEWAVRATLDGQVVATQSVELNP